MRLIDADAIRIKPEFMESIFDTVMIRAEDLARIITEQPVIEVPKEDVVVLCKNCKFRGDSIHCQLESEGMHQPDNWFCADGVAKKG